MIRPCKDRFGQKVWRYDIRLPDGTRKRKKGFSSAQAASIAASRVVIAVNEKRAGVTPPPSGPTCSDVIRKRINHLKVPKGSRGYYSRNQAIVDLERFLKITSGLQVTELRTAHFAEYRDLRLKSVKPQTVYRELTNLHACFNQAYETFSELESWRPPRRPSLVVPEGDREVTYSPMDAHRLLEYLRRPRLKTHYRYHNGEPLRSYNARLNAADYFQMALQTSKRAGEIRTRAWSDLLWHKNGLRVDSTKRQKEGVIYLPESLMQMLRDRRARMPESKWIFPSDLYPDKPMERLNVDIIRRACVHLGIEWGYGSSRGVVFHTTRHTATTAMLDKYDSRIVQAQTGHSDEAMMRRYNHPKMELHREAVQTLDQFASVPETDKEVTCGVSVGYVGTNDKPKGKRKRE